MELRGGEILLRRWRMDDAPTVAQACRDPEILRWIPFVPSPYTGEDARAYVRGCVDAPEGRQPFAITAADDGRLLGSIDMSVNTMRSGQVGYWVVAEAAGKVFVPQPSVRSPVGHSRSSTWGGSSFSRIPTTSPRNAWPRKQGFGEKACCAPICSSATAGGATP